MKERAATTIYLVNTLNMIIFSISFIVFRYNHDFLNYAGLIFGFIFLCFGFGAFFFPYRKWDRYTKRMSIVKICFGVVLLCLQVLVLVPIDFSTAYCFAFALLFLAFICTFDFGQFVIGKKQIQSTIILGIKWAITLALLVVISFYLQDVEMCALLCGIAFLLIPFINIVLLVFFFKRIKFIRGERHPYIPKIHMKDEEEENNEQKR